jgi:hypothetical protein
MYALKFLCLGCHLLVHGGDACALQQMVQVIMSDTLQLKHAHCGALMAAGKDFRRYTSLMWCRGWPQCIER